MTLRAWFHGAAANFAKHRRHFGARSAALLDERFGWHAYVEGARTAGGVSVPDQSEWLRIRLDDASRLPMADAVFQTAVGAAVEIGVAEPAPAAARPKAAKVKDGLLDAEVLVSHEQGLILAFDATVLRKLGGTADSWYRIVIGGEERPMRSGRGIAFDEEARVWAEPTTLLFDYIGHWSDAKRTLCLVTPMQLQWRGRFPDPSAIVMPTAAPGTRAQIRIDGTAG